MKYNFGGFKNWAPASGELDMLQGFDVFRASESKHIPRDVCEGCVCWRVWGRCVQVQVEDYELDEIMKSDERLEGYDLKAECRTFKNCCPILFFDFIGKKLPELDTVEMEEHV
jgi:hypothetical protein